MAMAMAMAININTIIMFTLKIKPEKYIQIGTEYPDYRFVNFGWNWDIKYYFFSFIPVIIYTKKLIK